MSGTTPTRYYWDSCVFLAWLLPESHRQPVCREVIESAEEGECEIVTSTLTLTEVVKLKGLSPLKQEQEHQIQRFFENDYITLIGVDRFVAQQARKLIWELGIRPKDSIHLATALRWIENGIEELHTFDNELLKQDKALGKGRQKLRICNPAAKQRRISSVLSAGEELKEPN